MAMGSTNRVVLNDEMQKAKGVCAAFRATVATFTADLESTVNTLMSSGFQGDAVDPKLGENNRSLGQSEGAAE